MGLLVSLKFTTVIIIKHNTAYVCISVGLHYFVYLLCSLLFTDITVHFDMPVYNTPASPVLILSHSVPCPVTIYVSDQNITANELSMLEGL